MIRLEASSAQYAFPSKSELGLNADTLINSNKITVWLCQKSCSQKDKRETRVAQNMKNKNPYALFRNLD